LKDFLAGFDDKTKIVTSEDVKKFFADIMGER
jgi:hypothetical protein